MVAAWKLSAATYARRSSVSHTYGGFLLSQFLIAMTKINNLNDARNLQLVSYSYLNNPIRFSVNGKVMVNATNMAKPFGKYPKHWLLLQSSKAFLQSLSVVRNLTSADLVIVRRGGEAKFQGTWMHEDVALEFARWLSPEFAIWCNDRIKEILQNRYPQSIKRDLEQLQSKNNELMENILWFSQRSHDWAKKYMEESRINNELRKQITKLYLMIQ